MQIDQLQSQTGRWLRSVSGWTAGLQAMSSRAVLAVLITSLVPVMAVGAGAVSSDARPATGGTGRIVLTVESATAGRPIPAGFVGLSMEYPTI